jgi:hypothetical protein
MMNRLAPTHIRATTTSSASGAGVVNGGFAAGNLTGWTVAGSTGVSGVVHGGSFAAMLGATGPTNGDSSITQTMSAPSGATRLSLWYQSVGALDSPRR